MQTIQDRGYVFKRGQALIPSFLAFAVVGLLERHYPRLVDYDFTAAMENELDEIAGGDAAALDFLTAFYFGSDAADDAADRQRRRAEEDGHREPRRDRRAQRQLDPAVHRRRGPRRRGPGRPLRAVPAADGARRRDAPPTSIRGGRRRVDRRRPGVDPRGHRARRADPGEGRRAVPRRRRRAQARRAPGDRRADRAQVRPVRPVRLQRRDATRRCSSRSRRTR